MDHSEIISTVIEFADAAHGDQTRKYSSDRYIVHPVRVMETCRQYTDRIAVLAAAVLHDVIEDTACTADDISAFLDRLMDEPQKNETLKLVVELTDVYVKKNYPAFNRYKRKKKELKRLSTISPDAQTIKYADILDNAAEIPQSDPSFAERYLKECLAVIQALKDGNPELRQKVENRVTAELEKIQSVE